MKVMSHCAATARFDSELVFASGAYAAAVEIDAATGKLTVRRVVAVDDAGTIINPLLAHGQIVGGAVQGLGECVLEEAVYDDDGQLITGTFVDYALATAAELPSFETDRTETRSPVNSMGVKGVGEAGTIAASAVVTNAVIDALRPLGVDYINMPLSPMRVWNAIHDSQGASPVPVDSSHSVLPGSRLSAISVPTGFLPIRTSSPTFRCCKRDVSGPSCTLMLRNSRCSS